MLSCVASPYFLVPDAVVDEDEDAVESVEDTEGGGDGQGRAVEEEEPQRPGENHEEQQCDGAPQPGPAGVEEGGEEVKALSCVLVATWLQETLEGAKGYKYVRDGYVIWSSEYFFYALFLHRG